MDSRPLRRPDRIGPPTSRQAARPIFRPPPAARVGPHSALDSRPGGPYMFRQIPNSQRRKSPRSRSLSFLLAALLVAISFVAAAAQDHSLSPEKRAQIEKAVSAFMTANSVPGVSVAVVHNGQPVWSAGFGMADLEDFSPATSSTL